MSDKLDVVRERFEKWWNSADRGAGDETFKLLLEAMAWAAFEAATALERERCIRVVEGMRAMSVPHEFRRAIIEALRAGETT